MGKNSKESTDTVSPRQSRDLIFLQNHITIIEGTATHNRLYSPQRYA